MKVPCIVLCSSILTAVTSMVVVILVIKSVVIPHVKNRYNRPLCTIRSVTQGPRHGCVHVTVHYMNIQGSFMHGYLVHRNADNTDKCFCEDCSIVTQHNNDSISSVYLEVMDKSHAGEPAVLYTVGQSVGCLRKQSTTERFLPHSPLAESPSLSPLDVSPSPSSLAPSVHLDETQTNSNKVFYPPDVTTPEVTSLKVTKQEGTAPEMNKSEVVKPEVSKPEMVQPEVAKPEVVNPEMTKPEITDLAIKSALLFPSLLFVAAFVACFISCIYVCRDWNLQEAKRRKKCHVNLPPCTVLDASTNTPTTTAGTLSK